MPKTVSNESLRDIQLNTGLNLVMALSYSSRWELVQAVQHIAEDVKAGKIDPAAITQNTLQQYLSTSNLSRSRINDSHQR